MAPSRSSSPLVRADADGEIAPRRDCVFAPDAIAGQVIDLGPLADGVGLFLVELLLDPRAAPRCSRRVAGSYRPRWRSRSPLRRAIASARARTARCRRADKSCLSIGVQKGPRIGMQKGPLSGGWVRLVSVANRRAPRASRSALTSDGAARAGGACLPTGASRGGTQPRFLKRQLALPVSMISQ
jgi:hypothetical protein